MRVTGLISGRRKCVTLRFGLLTAVKLRLFCNVRRVKEGVGPSRCLLALRCLRPGFGFPRFSHEDLFNSTVEGVLIYTANAKMVKFNMYFDQSPLDNFIHVLYFNELPVKGVAGQDSCTAGRVGGGGGPFWKKKSLTSY